jgi:hypothetical protein
MESVGQLATIDDQAVTAVGASEIAGNRFRRLLNDAAWGFGFFEEYVAATTMQATTMEANRLAELHRTADSIDGYFRAHRSGKAMVEAAHPPLTPTYLGPAVSRYDDPASVYDGPTVTYATTPIADWTTIRPATFYYSGIVLRPDAASVSTPDANGQVVAGFVYDGDSLVPANDADAIANDVRLTRTGGIKQVAEDAVSIDRYGRHTLSRNGLFNTTDGSLATYASRILGRRKNLVLRVVSVDLWCRPENLQAIMMLDLMDAVTVVLPDNHLAVKGHITSVEHSVSPRSPSAVLWTCRLGLMTYPGLTARQQLDIVATATVSVTDVQHPERLRIGITSTVSAVAIAGPERLALAVITSTVTLKVEYVYRYELPEIDAVSTFTVEAVANPERCLIEATATVTVLDIGGSP